MKVYRKRLFCSLYVMLLFSSNLWPQSLVSIKTERKKKESLSIEEKARKIRDIAGQKYNSEDDKLKAIANAIQEKKVTVPLEPAYNYEVLLSTELRDIIGNKDAVAGPFGTASFGIRRTSNNWSTLSLLIKVADNQAPINSNYGRALLNPGGLERAAGYLDYAFFFKKVDYCMFRAYATISTNDWQISDDLTDEVTSAQATITSLGIGAYKTIWNDQFEESSSEIISNVFIGITSRWISGDLAYTTNNDLRSTMLGLDNKLFPGVELYWDILFSGIKGFVDVTWFPHQIPGFSSLKLTAGIGFEAQPLKFKKK